ncbi:MAG: 2OG-Fe(II) oxygenase [Polaromonas sp.]|nr:2OG-Fe(II) oxygenase [Polaromonas sp.]
MVTPELRRWIEAQTALGHGPEALMNSMLQAGWSREDARAALHADQDSEGPAGSSAAPGIQPPGLLDGPVRRDGGDRFVDVLMAMREPEIVLFGGLLDAAECQALMEAARPRLSRSLTVDVKSGGEELNEDRTSQGMFFTRGESPLIARIEARIATLLGWPVENGEGLQVLRYGPGAEYKPHYDYFDPAEPGTATILQRGGQRVATLIMYLNEPAQGGATIFPDVRLQVAPQRGHAVFFSYDQPHPSTHSLHGGAPVIEGEKWVATKWLREREFS